MNIENITKALQVKLSTATTPTDLLLLTKAVQKLRLGAVDTVATYVDMVALTKNVGDLVFVDGEQKLYFKQSISGRWTPILDTSIQAWAWGGNSGGQLGDGTTTSRSSPVSVVGGFTGWAQVSNGSSHTVGITAGGTAWGWGDNFFGQLGSGNTTARSSPVAVVGGFTDWVQVSAGYGHTIALRANGTTWAWGRGDVGQIGNGAALSISSPVSVVGGFTNWVQVSAGRIHNVALRANGTAWAWGYNGSGQLGDNTTISKTSPVSVVGGFTNWVQLSAGGSHTVGVRANGTAWAWGASNSQGRLGDGTLFNRSSPVSVVGGFTDWVQVSAGDSHTLGVRANGTAWAWGYNNAGRLGDGTTTNQSSPVSVVGGFTDWVQVSAGRYHSAGIRSNGTAWGWGRNLLGAIGDGSITARSSPVSVAGGFTDWVQISAFNDTVALR